MTLVESVKTCFAKYADFQGRASRSEFWWFSLFIALAGLAAELLFGRFGALLYLVVLVPALAVTARRLHDTGRSGWWQLVGLVPVIGFIVMLVFLTQAGKDAAGGPLSV